MKVKRRQDKYITFATFMIGATGLVLLSAFLPSDFYLVALVCLLVAMMTLISAYLDKDIRDSTRLSFFILGLLYFILSMVGFLINEINLPVPVYCVLLGSFDIVKGLGEIIEVVNKFKAKNYMAVAFLIDALIDVVLGILMCIEREETLRLHVNLIAADCYYEGVIRLTDEIIAQKRGYINGQRLDSNL